MRTHRRLRTLVCPLVLALATVLAGCAAARPSGTDLLAADRTPDALLAALAQANGSFADHAADDVLRERAGLALKQEPPVAVLACADSRCAPEWVFAQRPGRLFVARGAGNVADVEAIASIEYAVEHLGTGLVVVLGHEACGAVKAAIAGGDPGSESLRTLVAEIAPAVEASRGSGTGDALVHAAVEQNARRSASALTQRSEILAHAVAEGHLRIVAAVHDLATGRVRFLE